MTRHRREETTAKPGQTESDAAEFFENTLTAVNASATKLYNELKVEGALLQLHED